MQKIITFLLASTLTLGSTSLLAAADTRYISDDLTINAFTIVNGTYQVAGTVSAGEEVTVLDESPSKKYALVRLSDGKERWVLLSRLSKDPSIKIQLPALKQQVESLTNELATINDSWNKKTADLQIQTQTDDSTITQLKKENTQLNDEIKSLQKRLDDMTLQMDDKQRSIIQQWFMYGGGVAGIGLLFGLILPYIIPRRKNKDRWMK